MQASSDPVDPTPGWRALIRMRSLRLPHPRLLSSQAAPARAEGAEGAITQTAGRR
jgi:hypothetical protein